jgi:hypothetical protein
MTGAGRPRGFALLFRASFVTDKFCYRSKGRRVGEGLLIGV